MSNKNTKPSGRNDEIKLLNHCSNYKNVIRSTSSSKWTDQIIEIDDTSNDQNAIEKMPGFEQAKNNLIKIQLPYDKQTREIPMYVRKRMNPDKPYVHQKRLNNLMTNHRNENLFNESHLSSHNAFSHDPHFGWNTNPTIPIIRMSNDENKIPNINSQRCNCRKFYCECRPKY